MTEEEIEDYVKLELQAYKNEDEGYVPGVDYILCKIEGCPRAFKEGQVLMCGLAKIGLIAQHTQDPMCGTTTTLDLWESEGKLDFLKD